MATSSITPPHAAVHEQFIEDLAQDTNAPLEHVRELYEAEHARLRADARIHTFVSIIAMRLVRNTLHAELPADH